MPPLRSNSTATATTSTGWAASAVSVSRTEPPVVSLALHPVGRLVARVAVTAGAIVAEHIVESGVFDLATGLRAPDEATGPCRDIEAGTLAPAGDEAAHGAAARPARPLAELVPLMLGDIEARLAPELARHRRDADQALAAELARIDGYYRQLLEESAEDGGVPGLGLLPGRAVRLREGRVPRMGWAQVRPGNDAFYFAHSYAAETSAATAYSEGIVAAAEAGSFLGVQFHPEKSGPAGARFLERCLSRA